LQSSGPIETKLGQNFQNLIRNLIV
jgi:hypothetical protein